MIQDRLERMLGMGRLDVLRRPQMRRRALAMADQGVSSLSNLVVAVLVARSFGGPAHFGAFSLAMVAYQIVLGSLRALAGEPLLSLYSHESASVRRKLAADLHATTLFLGVLCSLALWVVSAWVGDLSGSAILALALVLPLLLMQDTWRFLFIVDRPGAALAIDGVWLAAVMIALPLAPADASIEWFVVAWGLAGGLGALLGVVLGGRLPGRPHPWRWLVAHRSTSVRFFGEFVTARSASQFVLVGLGAIAGLSALGAAKASLVYFGLLNTLHMGLYLAVVPEGAQARREPAKLQRLMTAVIVGLSGLAIVWTVAGMVVPDRLGRELLGATWQEAEELMLPMGLAMVAGGLASGGFLGLRSLGDSRRSFAARMHSTVWQSVCPLVGAVLGGAMGFAIGFAAGRAAAAVVWMQAFRQGLDEAGSAAAGDPGPDDGPSEPSIDAAREEVVLG